MSSELPVYTRSTKYVVSALPEDLDEHYAWSVTVEWRGGQEWAVCRGRACYDRSGNQNWELSSNSAEEIAKYRFPLGDAISIAERVARRLIVNGRTVEEVLSSYRGEAT